MMNKRLSIRDIRAQKNAVPLVTLTAYTTPVAKLLDPHCDILLVGDSLGMVMYGMDSTLNVSLDMMINHGKAVMRGSSHALVVVDMPFGTYQESPVQAFRNAARVMAETGAQAVKLEGGREMEETIAFLAARGIPVMGHIGLKPQSVNALGGFRAQGRDDDEAAGIMADALAVEEAGAFSVVIEGVIENLSAQITKNLNIPTIGIGASVTCDGQVLVIDDMLGIFNEFQPRFVKRYANLSENVTAAVKLYAAEVRERKFPGPEHCFGMKKP